MQKRFTVHFTLVVLAHALLIFLALYLGRVLTSKPKPKDNVAWINPGVLAAMGQQGLSPQTPAPVPPAPVEQPTPQPPAPPTPPPDPPPKPTPPQPVPPSPQPQKTPPPTKPIPKAPTPATPQKNIPVKATAKGNLNVADKPPQTTPQKPEPPKPPASAPPKQAPPQKPATPVITKSDKVVTRTTAASTPSKQENPSKPAPNETSSSSQQSISQEKSDALESLQSIAKNISAGGAKSGLTTSMTIGTFGSSGGKESDFSDYFNHIRSRMIDAWNQPQNLASRNKLKTGIRMKIARNGAVSSVSLASSSGNTAWDESALAAARKVNRVNSLPEGLGDSSGLNLTIYFEPEN